MVLEESRRRRIWWRSRRGLLELDLLLVPFVEQEFAALSPREQDDYERLLEEDDPLLLDWFERRAEPLDEGLKRIVERILG
ncbi:MAG: succinate dehydrogenase assembly factor 2 [Gammaproteobacteria bacterium]|jgi:antitoxin CptB